MGEQEYWEYERDELEEVKEEMLEWEEEGMNYEALSHSLGLWW